VNFWLYAFSGRAAGGIVRIGWFQEKVRQEDVTALQCDVRIFVKIIIWFLCICCGVWTFPKFLLLEKINTEKLYKAPYYLFFAVSLTSYL